MKTGILKTWNLTKGFGWITPNDGSKDAMLYSYAIINGDFKAPKVGDKVSFTPVNGPGGVLNAANATIL
ncbi:cold shock domain-containing protein [Mucilaginibacter terrigena]|uniref:Cold shock domain-containing protein n=1 Tax=Mucilaginibacter terrigena TaxID=2492395 RepID=A0A4Q5LJW2_9SPHI|nr:cold shock domain-containing protein [Mucilaginibacter terrigena]RYU89954.1 cold shock domain-containing protein [Mucilaginibacter terrigena]